LGFILFRFCYAVSFFLEQISDEQFIALWAKRAFTSLKLLKEMGPVHNVNGWNSRSNQQKLKSHVICILKFPDKCKKSLIF